MRVKFIYLCIYCLSYSCFADIEREYKMTLAIAKGGAFENIVKKINSRIRSVIVKTQWDMESVNIQKYEIRETGYMLFQDTYYDFREYNLKPMGRIRVRKRYKIKDHLPVLLPHRMEIQYKYSYNFKSQRSTAKEERCLLADAYDLNTSLEKCFHIKIKKKINKLFTVNIYRKRIHMKMKTVFGTGRNSSDVFLISFDLYKTPSNIMGKKCLLKNFLEIEVQIERNFLQPGLYKKKNLSEIDLLLKKRKKVINNALENDFKSLYVIVLKAIKGYGYGLIDSESKYDRILNNCTGI